MTTTLDPQTLDRYRDWERTLRHFVVWCLVCWVAAGPSFFFGSMLANAQPVQLAAMAVGVFLFAGLYTEVSTSRWFGDLRRRPFVERTLKIGYGLRLAQSFLAIVPPVIFVDVIAGAVSIGLANALFGGVVDMNGHGVPGSEALAFAAFLVATLIQGCLLNIILVVLMLFIQGIQQAFCTPPATGPTGFCLKCKYDLRASKDVCPECGEPIPAGPSG